MKEPGMRAAASESSRPAVHRPAAEPTERGVVRAYDRFAPLYDLLFGRVLEPGRRRMAEVACTLAPASLLEVGVGTGLTLARYPTGARVTGIDISADMLSRAQARAAAMPGRDISCAS